MVGEAGGDEALVDHHGGFLESRVHVAVGPFGDRLAHGELALTDRRKVRGGPLDRLDRDASARDVAVAAGIGSAGVQALQRIECEGQGFQVQFDQVDGILRGGLVHGGHRENGLAHVTGLVGQDRRRRRAGRLRRRNVIGGQYRVHAFQGQCGRHVDIAHPRVGHRTGQQLAEEHSLGAKILRVLGLPGHLAPHIRRHEITANQRISHVVLPFFFDIGERGRFAPADAIEITTKTGARSRQPGRGRGPF